ncbi:hypoxanthine phosphoribosyltransferase [Verrucomicrobiota bacterium]
MENEMLPHHTERIIYSAEQIRERIPVLVDEIVADQKNDFVMIGILRGSFMFMADLLRSFNRHALHPQIDFITLTSYKGTESTGEVKLTHDTDLQIEGREVLLVDDILDTGRTLSVAKEIFMKRGATSVKSCVLLDKQTERAVEFHADHAAFPVEDVFVVGYGLDYDNHYRELPHIAEVTFLS